MTSTNDHGKFDKVDSANSDSGEATPPPKDKAGVARKEIGGPKGPDPTRFGDWERNGRCIDF